MPASKLETMSAVQIIAVDSKTNDFKLQEDNLKKLLLSDKVKDLPVVIVSVAGPFRLGKSFLLNFFLRYLYHEGEEDDWLGDESASLDPSLAGFKWAHGSTRDTTGMWMWSEPLIRTLPCGKKVAVLLIDTQGTFDNQTTAEVNAMVFALNALISSFQVYNISKRIGEDILQHMHLFTKFGRMISEQQSGAPDADKDAAIKPFQKLMFLVRDWGSPKTHANGIEGGAGHLGDVLKVDDENIGCKELSEVREDIKNCFADLSCYLMPHPGLAVAEGDGDEGVFEGQLSAIRASFREQLKDLVPRVVGSPNLAVKRVLGEEVTCSALYKYIEAYTAVFSKGVLPEVHTVFNATAKLNHSSIKAKAKEAYDNKVKEFTGAGTLYRDEEELKAILDEAKKASMAVYQDTPKLAAEAVEKEMTDELDEEMEQMYKEALAVNDNKGILSHVKTPIIFIGVGFLATVVGHVFAFIYIDMLASLCGYITWMCFLVACFSMYSKHTGKYPDVAKQIEEAGKKALDIGKEQAVMFMANQAVGASKKTN